MRDIRLDKDIRELVRTLESGLQALKTLPSATQSEFTILKGTMQEVITKHREPHLQKGKLSEKQKDFYLSEGGNLCPFCDCENMGYNDQDIVLGAFFTVEISCDDCLEKWKDTYRLYEIEDMLT